MNDQQGEIDTRTDPESRKELGSKERNTEPFRPGKNRK